MTTHDSKVVVNSSAVVVPASRPNTAMRRGVLKAHCRIGGVTRVIACGEVGRSESQCGLLRSSHLCVPQPLEGARIICSRCTKGAIQCFYQVAQRRAQHDERADLSDQRCTRFQRRYKDVEPEDDLQSGAATNGAR